MVQEAARPSPPVRSTQSFVHTLASVWRRPSLTALEIAWRWVYGIPAAALILWQVRKVLLAATSGTLDPARLGFDKPLLSDPVGALTADPAGAAGKLAGAVALLLPALEHLAVWLLPLLLAGWVVASAVGRSLLLQRVDPRLQPQLPTLVALQALRAAALTAWSALWFILLCAIGRANVTQPIAHGAEPNLVFCCALVIVTTLGMFTAWAFISWPLSLAPVLALSRRITAMESLRSAMHLARVKGRLIEVNLVMGIVKIALLVLALVFSATPLPFESVTTNAFLTWWWAGVGLFYVLWSDFFHAVRLVACLQLWNADAAAKPPER